MEDIFNLPAFFITFREALETAIIVSVLLALIDRMVPDEAESDRGQEDHPSLHRRLFRQVWLGTGLGTLAVVLLGAFVLVRLYGLEAGSDPTFAGTEDIWEGVFSLLASVLITMMGAVLLRVSKLQDKWRVKLARALEAADADRVQEAQGITHGSSLHLFSFLSRLGEKYALAVLPCITILREGFEAVLFLAGVGLGIAPAVLALSAAAGLLAGAFVGYLIYRGSHGAPLQYLLIVSTCFLYLVGAGLFSKGVWHLEAYQWNLIVGGDAAELGSGPGSYDIRKSVWHVNCCNPDYEGGGFWGVFNALLGWQNSATVGSVISYNLYWAAVMGGFLTMIAREKGYRYPLPSFLSTKTSEDDVLDGCEASSGALQPLLSEQQSPQRAI